MKIIYLFQKALCLGFFIFLLNGCSSEALKDSSVTSDVALLTTSSLSCNAQAEQTDYSIYRMTADGSRIGDVMPYYDATSNSFYVYYLKDIWNDSTNKRHPWYGFKTTDFYSYSELSAGEILSCNTNICTQDFALGTGNIIKNGSNYYAFYTGHNPNYPSSCVTKKEGIMLATSTSLNTNFTPNTSFATIYPPTGQGFDENDNFRDPYVFWDANSSQYIMLVSARKNVSGTWKGVIVKYTSTNLINWTYQGVLYDGGSQNFFMMETPEIFNIGSTYYLLFSDINSKFLYYRKSSSINGPWSMPSGSDRFDGTGFYAAKTATNGTDRYIFAWTNILTGNTDSGTWAWGGNLAVHKLYQKANGDLAVAIPHTLKNKMETTNYTPVQNSQWGNITSLSGGLSYQLSSTSNFDVANIIYDPINLAQYKISASVSFSSCNKDFGFMIGACDGYENFYSLRFVPSQNRFSLDKTVRSQLNTSTVAYNDVPYTFSPNILYDIQIVIENSILTVYINNEVALSSRVYKASNTSWGIFTDNSTASFYDIKVTKP
ncbi:beta-fructofuranosidase [Flavobacterium palustre]|uniref:beta-fructofuranosidase n=1 Tax=Flavobacterium palustre TaxID=1476463 RepID=A0ABQ1H9Y3_9FLAO|nr:glycoside hydrolase family 32 protein [Flavobacterium palustre]GGA65808.1 beta-fructofuranosidase [Flavobacterium palustre]